MTKEYLINIKHVDNRMVIFLNGTTIWDSGIVHGDPPLNQFINITQNLTAHATHTSELIFEGFNDTYKAKDGEALNPWHFHYEVIVRTRNRMGEIVNEENMLPVYNEKHFSNPNTRAINNCYQIARKNDSFKVISNTLVQHFYS